MVVTCQRKVRENEQNRREPFLGAREKSGRIRSEKLGDLHTPETEAQVGATDDRGNGGQDQVKIRNNGTSWRMC
jgi:hypothetical protein